MANEFKLPDVGEGIESGVVVGILVAVGDSVEVDQPVLELETDKAVVEVPSSVAGVVETIHVSQNDEAKVGQVILTLGEGKAEGEGKGKEESEEDSSAEADEKNEAKDKTEEEPAKAQDASKDEAKEGRADEEAEQEADKPEAKTEHKTGKAPYAGKDAKVETESESRHTIPAAPSVRRLARELGVDLSAIEGSGLAGRISEGDVKRAAEGAPAAAAQAPAQASKLPDFSKWGEVERQAMSGVRRATAKQMAVSWSNVPHVTQFDKADITELERLRKAYAKRVEAAGGGKLTPTASVLKVAATALKVFPDFNASIDVAANEIVYKHYVHIGVAVDTKRGLLVPVIRDADKKNITELSKELNETAERARSGKTSLDEMQGGTFTITNLGGIGGTGFTPIVNHPEVAILGVSKASMEPVYIDGEFQPRLMMPVSLSYDHRLIDGASAARFLRWICEALEQPFLLALEG